jgi:sentrin-specific protease 7
VQEISANQAPTTPTLQQYGLPRSTQSTRSRHSAGSGWTLNGRQSGSQSRNEFQEIEKQMQSSLKASKKQHTPGIQRRPSLGRSVSGSLTPRPQETPVHVLDEELETVRATTRGSIFQGFTQGMQDCIAVERNVPRSAEETTSHHFPNARINESTAAPTAQTTNQRQPNGDSKTLRAFRRSHEVVDNDPISDDELGMDVPQHQKTPTKKQRSGSNTSQTANTGVKRKSKAAKLVQRWPLIWARNLDFDSLQLPLSKKDEQRLYLRSDPENNTFRVVAYDDASGDYETQATITSQDVVKVWLDNVGRIRLEGSRPQDGNQRMVDLEFLNTPEFEEFRDTHVAALSGRDIPAPKEEKHMQLLFSKPLRKNNKVGSLPLIEDAPLLGKSEDVTNAQIKSRPLWEHMKLGAQSRNDLAPVDGAVGSYTRAGSTQSSARSTRSTRASAPTHNVAEDPEESQVGKYSELHGLGKAWRDPLVFSHGRYRANVNFTDLLRLDEGELLNDNLIDFYMIYCFKQSNVPQEKVFFFNTFFFSKLTENTGRASMNYKAVERWTSKVDIFSYDYIVVPINEDTHWYLAIICNVGNIDRKAVQEEFGDGSIQEGPTASTTFEKQEGPTASEPLVGIKLADSADVPLPSRPPSAEQVEDDVNLFDEKLELDLIDREDVGTEEEKDQASAHTPPVPQPPQDIAPPKASSIFDQTDAPNTVLSNLNTSPKKKPKRRPIAPKKDPDQPIIIIMDSLSSARSSAVRALKDWLAAEGENRRGMEAVIREKGYYPKGDQIPTQSNYSDCGVYLLGYAEKFFQDPDEFKRKLLLGEMTADEHWPELKPGDMRNNLREILFTLANEQELIKPKKQRGKKAPGVSSIPTPPTVESAMIERMPNPPHAQETAKTAELSSVPMETVSATPEEVCHRRAVSRLGSPFTPRPSAEKSVSRSGTSRAAEEPTFSASTSPAKTTTRSPRLKQTPGRRTHPEVRIAKQSPVLQQVSAAPEAVDSPRQTKPASRSVSPLKRARQPTDDNGLGTLPKKKYTAGCRSAEEKRTSPVLAAPYDGHSDHPIEIMDSQESKAKATQSPQRIHRGSPAQRKQPSRSPRTAQTLHHAPSIEEICSFPANTIERKYGHVKKRTVDHQLVSKLNADDEQRQISKYAKAGSRETPVELDRAEEPALEVMDVDFQGIDPMDIADDVIGETPSPQRSSPPSEQIWVKGDSLIS